jgi:glycosyltransferase involved in cell wall biosynthesis
MAEAEEERRLNAAERPIRVLFLTRSLVFGGAERQIVVLASELSRRGHEVLIAPLYDEIPLAPELEGTGVTIEVIGKSGRWDILGFFRRLFGVVRRFQPDVIQTYLPVPNLIGIGLAPVTRIPLVWGIRSSDMDLSKYDWLTGLTYRAEHLFSRIPKRIIVNSDAGRKFCEATGYDIERLAVVPNAVNREKFHPSPDERNVLRTEWGLAPADVVVGVVARLDPLKDHQMFLDAAARITSQHPEVRFAVVGGGPDAELQRLRGIAQRLGIADRVLWTGARNDMRAVYNALDLVCLSSITEGFPNVLVEALACGTPCISTDVGDARLILRDDRLVVPRRNAEAFAGAMRIALDELPALRGRTAALVEEYSVATLGEKTERIYRDAIS